MTYSQSSVRLRDIPATGWNGILYAVNAVLFAMITGLKLSVITEAVGSGEPVASLTAGLVAVTAAITLLSLYNLDAELREVSA